MIYDCSWQLMCHNMSATELAGVVHHGMRVPVFLLLLQPPLAQLSEDPDLHVRELAFAARQYAVATAENPKDYDALYNHGLVLQELSGRLPAASADQASMLRQVSLSQFLINPSTLSLAGQAATMSIGSVAVGLFHYPCVVREW